MHMHRLFCLQGFDREYYEHYIGHRVQINLNKMHTSFIVMATPPLHQPNGNHVSNISSITKEVHVVMEADKVGLTMMILAATFGCLLIWLPALVSTDVGQ